MLSSPRTSLLLALAASLLTVPIGAADDQKAPVVSIQKGSAGLDISIDGKPFFTYQYDTEQPELRRPVIHPLYGPNGAVISQLGEIPGKRTAHYWHTGLWIAHQNFTRGNNWQMDADPKASPRKYSSLLHRGFDEVSSGKVGRIIEKLEWDDIKGTTILLDETRTITVPHRPADRRVIDFDLVLTARKEPVTLNATPYEMIAFRGVNSMVPAFSKEAAITNSEGKKNPKDGEPAKWIDVSGPVDGQMVGVALFNRPDNHRHPTPCMNFANQTIGLSPTHRQSHTLQPGESLRLRYRVLVHVGTTADGNVVEEHDVYCKETKQ